MALRVNPVVLYGNPVILGPEKSKSQLRISEKKFGSKKNALSDKALKGFFRKASHQGKLF
jgi:hypothetical protein